MRPSAGIRILTWISATVLFLGLVIACSSKSQLRPRPAYDREGYASYYSGKLHGRKTANGERYDQHSLTAAHRSLPFGTIVVVQNLKNGRSVQLRINDRGPFVRGRIIDISYAAAKKLGMIRDGIVRVRVTTLD